MVLTERDDIFIKKRKEKKPFRNQKNKNENNRTFSMLGFTVAFFSILVLPIRIIMFHFDVDKLHTTRYDLVHTRL